jgi:lipoprotein-anchoring transpeptidase ErfK/SrfK
MAPRIWIPSIAIAAVLVLGAWGVEQTWFGDSKTDVESSPTTTEGVPSAVDDHAPAATAPPAAVSTTVTSTTTSTVPPDLLPADSGSGHRVVLSVAGQRMWWVDGNDTVVRTALVSGRPNTPESGTFQVYSKTLNATGIDGSTMDYFVRFTKGPNGWAIGFHDIPEMNGEPVQTPAELGTPLSHGCIRQAEADAQFTWDFLDVGSTVVVVA